MKFSVRRVLLQLILIFIVISCFQAIIFIFPAEAGKIYSSGRLLSLFLMSGIVLVHNLVFNHYMLKVKKLVIYLPTAITLILLSAMFFVFLAPASANHSDSSGLWIVGMGVSVFFFLAGLGLNVICIQLMTKSNYYENQLILKQMEVDRLKNQLNPHFLFNSLNNVAATIQVDSELALNYIYTLSSLLRYQIESSGKELVTLAEENFFIESFLGIEEFRLGERCELSFESEITNPGVKLPPMLLQPFVEQAIKNCCSLNTLASVKITLREKNKELFLIINYPVLSNEVSVQDEGAEIENAKRRLKMFYLSSHQITTQLEGGFFETTLFIDLKSYKLIS
jgi:sensor histidine kinase YesM